MNMRRNSINENSNKLVMEITFKHDDTIMTSTSIATNTNKLK